MQNKNHNKADILDGIAKLLRQYGNRKTRHIQAALAAVLTGGLFLAAPTPAKAGLTSAMESINVKLASLNANLEEQIAKEDEKYGITGQYANHNYNYNIEHITQKIEVRDGRLVSLLQPISAARPRPVRGGGRLDPLERLRLQHGGVIPYVVVRAKEPFLLTSEEGDILAIGLRNPEMEMVEREPTYSIKQGRDGEQIMTQRRSENDTVIVTENLNVQPEMPPWLNPHTFQKERDYTNKEVCYAPNHEWAYPTSGRQATVNGETLQIFEMPIRDRVVTAVRTELSGRLDTIEKSKNRQNRR